MRNRSEQQMSGTSGVLISVCDDPGLCPICGGPWHVQKTVPRHGKTLSHGQFEIWETVHVCANRCQYASGSLVTRLRDALRLVPKSIPDSKTCSDTDISIPDAALKELVDIRENVDQLVNSLEDRRHERGPAKDTRKSVVPTKQCG